MLSRIRGCFSTTLCTNFRLSPTEIEEIIASLPSQVIADIKFAQAQVRNFAQCQREAMRDIEVETLPGVILGHKNLPVNSVGCYVPGGRYPMVASAHMSVVTAKVAGVKRIVACTPPMGGAPPAATVAAMALGGADEIYILGGVQAVCAMAVGTANILSVDMIVGPGNAYVAEAKRQLFGRVGIDLLAGPTEVLVIADDTADPKILAADLLAQAEHDPETRVGLITTSRRIAEATLREVERQLGLLATAQVADAAWQKRGEIVLCRDEADMIVYSDHIAAEHLQVHTADAEALSARLRNYGSLFIGQDASVVYSDKVSGTNHILPTGGAAHYTGGVWVGTFLKVCTHQRIERSGVEILAHYATRQSAREGLEGHRKAAEIRINYDVV
jgi:sulfopropanediol 3-dehydrogenase